MRLSKKSPTVDIPDAIPTPSFDLTRSAPEPQIAPHEMSVIGPKIKLVGELSGEEDLAVEGHFEGSINLLHNHLMIGPQGDAKATVNAKAITVEGKIEGQIGAKEVISIKDNSLVVGKIKAERIQMEDGAHFKGEMDV